MKFVSYKKDDYPQLALLWEDKLYDMQELDNKLPPTMESFLNNWKDMLPLAQNAVNTLQNSSFQPNAIPLSKVELLAPVPHPGSCRDGYAFRQHVATARHNRGLPMIPEFDEFPVFYFTNHRSITGPGDIICQPDHLEQLDYELEVAIVICKEGKNILAKDADKYIGGLMIMNDLSARKLQMQEMKLNLGPAKGKDFATAIGPWLVTLDELQPYETSCKKGHIGKSWNLQMECCVNGELLSEGNLAEMDWTFAEIIERASYGVILYPGDIIGSGTVGTGCLLELNGTALQKDPGYISRWLREGDKITMKITGLGMLENNIKAENSAYSLLRKKQH